MNTPVIFKKLWSHAVRFARSGGLRGVVAAVRAALGRVFKAKAPGEPARSTPSGGESGPAPELPQAQFREGSHTEGHHVRAFKLFVPPHEAGVPLPLVVMLHGCTQSPDDFAIGTGMNDLALAQGFLVLYPAQSTDAHGHRCWNWYQQQHQQRGQGEPAVLAGMTRAVMAEYRIDSQRVYVAGLSAGGAMAAILGDAYPELFSAVGVHSGLATGSARDLASAWVAMKGHAGHMIWGLPGWRVPGSVVTHGRPTIVFHGDSDKTVHPINGARVVAASLGASALVPPRLHRASTAQGCSYTRYTHQDARGHVGAEHWVVHGAGHAWSGGRTQGSYTDPKGPDASTEMLRFFWAHPAPTLH